MTNRARADLRSLLEDMAALSPWANAGDPAAPPFVAAFEAARARALAAAPLYAEAAKKSPEMDLRSWLGDMEALKRWADSGDPEDEPFVAAFEAARARALAAAAEAAKKT